jgi:formate dehydrogenase subunit gamma
MTNQIANKNEYISWNFDQALEIINDLKSQEGALMPILTKLLETFGYIDNGVVPELAKILNISRAEVHGVISFYSDFRTSPPGTYEIKVCRAEACQALGASKLIEFIKNKLDLEWHQTSNHQAYTLTPIYCFGNCACGPSMMINNVLYGRVSQERFTEILNEIGDIT